MVAAIILVCALGITSIDFSIGSFDISLTSLAVAAIAGILLNAILPGNDYEFNDEELVKKKNDKEAEQKQKRRKIDYR